MAPLELNKAEAKALQAAEEINDGFLDASDRKEAVGIAQAALARSPLCADAYINLASHAGRGPTEALFYWHAAVAAGEMALGEQAFEDFKGSFWGVHETRPYMRAKQGLALALWASDKRHHAIGHAEDMLRLNPNDNQGTRDIVLNWYIQTDQDKKARVLLKRYREDDSAAMTWSAALLAFRQHGRSDAANSALAVAAASNRFVAALVAGQLTLPKKMPNFYAPGEPSEAIVYWAAAREAWTGTSDAAAWVVEQIEAGAVVVG